jgi:drug/metabolite transporter (DMT)-like permease
LPKRRRFRFSRRSSSCSVRAAARRKGFARALDRRRRGFAGILLITRPGSAAFHPATLLMLVMALSNALYQILTRKLTANRSTRRCVHRRSPAHRVHAAAAVSRAASAPGLRDALLFLALGVFAGVGHW